MSKPKYAWDTSVFIAWLVDDSSHPLSDIDAVVGEIDNGDAILIVSATTYSEILEEKNAPEQMKQFSEFLKRSNVVVVDVTIAVAEKASQIRSKGVNHGTKISTPDAQHIATAILYQADMLHTLDSNMLSLNGHAIVDGLRIVKPLSISGQRSLF